MVNKIHSRIKFCIIIFLAFSILSLTETSNGNVMEEIDAQYTRLIWDKNQQNIFYGTQYGALGRWNLQSGNNINEDYIMKGSVSSLSLNANKSLGLITTNSNYTSIWEEGDMTSVGQYGLSDIEITSGIWDPYISNIYYTGDGQGNITKWDLSRSNTSLIINSTNLRDHGISFFELSQNDNYLAIGFEDDVVSIIDLTDFTILHSFGDSQFLSDTITDIKWSPNDNLIAVSYLFTDVKIWNISNELLIKSIIPDNALNVFGAMDFSPDGSYLFIGASSTFQIYEISTWEIRTFYFWEHGLVTDAIWTDDNRIIIAAALTLVVTNVPNLNILENDLLSLDFGDNSSLGEIVFYGIIAIILISTYMGIPALRRYHPIGIGYYFIRVPIFAAIGLVYLVSFHIPKILEYVKNKDRS
ncbi:MAG: hypothetical protein GPJ54_19855 [Candidatus Heimdallarchaeota archaeon]|nr:hypothetical protein [Candidatus Heimdallarchaeota archaeon]